MTQQTETRHFVLSMTARRGNQYSGLGSADSAETALRSARDTEVRSARDPEAFQDELSGPVPPPVSDVLKDKAFVLEQKWVNESAFLADLIEQTTVSESPSLADRPIHMLIDGTSS